MLIVRMSTEVANARVREGKVGELMQNVMAQLQPEAAYFGPYDGGRTAFLVVNLDDPAKIPAISEPFFQNLGARIEFIPVMTAEDLARGLAELPQGASAG
jgi:hypothetical protein